MTTNQPYVKKYDDKGILLNPIGLEGYLHQFPSSKSVKKMLKQGSNNSRKGRNYLQVVSFYKDSEGKIVKNGESISNCTHHTRTIEHKRAYFNISRSPKDYTIYGELIDMSKTENND